LFKGSNNIDSEVWPPFMVAEQPRKIHGISIDIGKYGYGDDKQFVYGVAERATGVGWQHSKIQAVEVHDASLDETAQSIAVVDVSSPGREPGQ
jgi:hypothetical protein